jgi:hypothetical protein
MGFKGKREEFLLMVELLWLELVMWLFIEEDEKLKSLKEIINYEKV